MIIKVLQFSFDSEWSLMIGVHSSAVVGEHFFHANVGVIN